MLRVPLNKAWIHRTIRPNYAFTQATPNASILDANWDRSVQIYPGMCAMKTSGHNVTLLNATGEPFGLFGEYIGGDGLDEPVTAGVNVTAVWVLGNDAEFEILSPAFDTGAAWVDPANGTIVKVHAYVDGVRRGQLTPFGTTGRGTLSTKPVVRLIAVDSASKIIVGGLAAGDA